MSNNLTKEQLKENLHYEPETGIFTWLCVKPKVVIGSIAGSIDFYGYRQIKISQKMYKAHRLAWLYMTGEWPKDQIDHINMNKSDNRWCNLREANNSNNQANKRKYKNNTSGIKGIRWSADKNKWLAQIRTNNKTINLGRYDSKEDAAKAYADAAFLYHGEYAQLDLESTSKPNSKQ